MVDYKKMTVAQLREECKKRGIDTMNMKKSDMVDNLLKYKDEHKDTQGKKEADEASVQPKNYNEMTESEKIRARMQRFSCDAKGSATKTAAALGAEHAEELRKQEERRRRFAKPINK